MNHVGVTDPDGKLFNTGDLEASSVASSSSNDNGFFNLSEDHFSEVTPKAADSDENGLPNDKKDVIRAINKYMRLIRTRENTEGETEQLICKLCDLRIKLNRMNEDVEEKYFHGHRLNKAISGDNATSSMICDICLKKQKMFLIPPGILKSLNFNFVLNCESCSFKIHRNCITNDVIVRPCPRELFETEDMDDDVSNSEKYSKYVVLDICPEIGLNRQGFKCPDCRTQITLNSSRLCDYDGRYYCSKCHWGDMEQTPARVLHNWDFEARPVSRRNLQIINYIKKRPVMFNLLEFNTMLYGLIDELNLIKGIRLELATMVQYIRLCRQPSKPKINLLSYLFEESECDSFVFGDLLDTESLLKTLSELHVQLEQHITKDCESCRGKAFYCELCNDRSDLLFPFSQNIGNCAKCNCVFHKNCFHRKHKRCPKCERIREKQLLAEVPVDTGNELSTELSMLHLSLTDTGNDS